MCFRLSAPRSDFSVSAALRSEMFPGLHVDRITRGYRDYRDPGQLAFVRLKQGKGNFSEDPLQQQSSPDRDCVVDVCRRLPADTSLQRHAICLSGEQD